MREKTLKFDNITVNKKEFHKSKHRINWLRLNKRRSNSSVQQMSDW